MKCENCGKNEVTFVYRSNVNGHVEESTCAATARKSWAIPSGWVPRASG